MNITIKSRTAGATVLLAVLLGSAACGSETVSGERPRHPARLEARIYPPVSVPVGLPEVEARAACLPTPPSARPPRRRLVRTAPPPQRWARGTQVENKLQGRLPRPALKKDGTDPLGQRSVPSFVVVSGRPRG